MTIPDISFGYSFPAIRGIQAGREYYASMCPMRLIPKIFLYDEAEADLPPETRAQRTLNRQRIPEMSAYITENPDTYTFSALTASIDGEVLFEALGSEGDARRVGVLKVSMDAKFIINDGQHRRAAIEQAVREEPGVGDESIAVVFFVDRGLKRCQQMFADLNRYSIRPSKSLGILYDHRDDLAELVRLMVVKSELLRDLVELERTSLSIRSRKLFTLSALYQATDALLDGMVDLKPEARLKLAAEFWETIARVIPEWEFVKERKVSSGDVRKDLLHSHGIGLHAIGIAGNKLVTESPKVWKAQLKQLGNLDWSRKNTNLWEGRALIGGKVSKARHNLILTTNVVKNHLGLELSPSETLAEQQFRKDK